MFRHIRSIAFLAVFLGLTGCAGLAKMKEVTFEKNIEPDMAMVNIVRRSVFMGDGAEVEAWDGDKLIGTLSSGTLIQYKTQPGVHTFMVYVQGRWGVAKGELKPGKTYYLKFNMTGWGPVTLGIADANDPRIDEWNMMTTVVIDESSQKKIPEKYITDARKILKRVEEGDANVTLITDSHAL